MTCRLSMRAQGAASLLAATCVLCPLARSQFGAPGTPASLADAISEEKVKAAFVIRFLNYVEWPVTSFPKPETPCVIGVIGAPALASELEKSVAVPGPGRRQIVVRQIGESDAMPDVHVMFIGAVDPSTVKRWLSLANLEPVLLITEVDGTLPKGSMINFRLVENRVRFDVALEPAERVGLKMNSRLLSVAMTVTKGSAP